MTCSKESAIEEEDGENVKEDEEEFSEVILVTQED